MLSKEQIEGYLQEIAESLQSKQIDGEIILCGGAVMTWYYESRDQTRDIDAAFSPQSVIRDIAKGIALEDDLESDWLNDGAKGFIDTTRMRFVTVMDLPGLTVKMPDAEAMLAMKLAAARIEGRDKEDTLFLMKHLDVKSLDQVYEILEKNIHPSQLTAQVSLFTQAMYQEYDEGRQSRSASDSMARAQQGAKALSEDKEPQVGIEGKTR